MTAIWHATQTMTFTGACASGKGGFAPFSGDNGAAATGLIV